MDTYFGDFRFINLIFQRTLAAVYLVAFVAALNQFPALLGEKGLLLAGVFEKGPWWLPASAWLGLYFLYLSIVNVGQNF